jgi:hypothetical protein
VVGARRLSQAIAEGDGISVLVTVGDGDSARKAEAQGADGFAVRPGAFGVREATQLPLLYLGDLPEVSSSVADAVVLAAGGDQDELAAAWSRVDELGLECVVRVAEPGALERALEELDPEVVLLSPEPEEDEDALELLLALLHDVPAGKLAIAELHDASSADVAELERAGVDAVLVSAGDIAALVGVELPSV